MALLEPDSTLELPGVRIRSEGVGGRVEAVALGGPGADRGIEDLETGLIEHGAPENGVTPLAEALRAADVQAFLAIPLDDLTTAVGPASTRGDDQAPAVEVTVDAPTEGENQVVLEVDGSGVVSWHFPVSTDSALGFRATEEQVFWISVRQADIPGEPPAGADRALLGIGVRKLLHVLRYPVQRAAGAIAERMVSSWEDRQRPYGLRLLGDAGLDGAPGVSLTSDQVAALSGNPTLLLLHGTFSTAAAGFAGLAADTALLAELRRRYQDRILVFDHPSVSVSPVHNARWLLNQVPPDVDLVLDVLAHSRGGLVGRALTAAPSFGDGTLRPPPVVRHIVHVATPNAGTTLASPERWGTLLDVVTNLAMFLPDTASVPLGTVVETVKQLGTGVLEGLDGLASMDPGGAFLPGLTPANGTRGTRGLSIASNYEPTTGPVPLRALDVLVDNFFAEGNDLVVPTAGVSNAQGLEIEQAVTVPLAPAVNHTGYFRDPEVRRQIAEWLTG